MAEMSNRWTGVGIVASVLVHAVGFWALGSVPRAKLRPLLPSLVDFEVKTAQAASEPPPEPEPDPPPPEELPSEPVRASRPLEPEPEPEPTPPPVADLTGLTLTSTGAGSGWASAVGNGRAMERPIRAGVTAKATPPKPVEAPPALPAPRKPSGPAIVAVKDLSQRPVPPDLNGVLEAHYPKSAREMGLEGSAVVRLRIDPDGRVRVADVVSESGAGFGSACRSTVMGSSWTAPRDRDGNSVATFVKYTCRFRVNR